MKKKLILGISIYLICTNLFADNNSDLTARYFEKIKNDPLQLNVFLQKMPKGGDLHNHLGGANMAENLIAYGKNDKLCVDLKTFNVRPNPLCSPENMLDEVPSNSTLYNAIIDAWSMRNFHPGKESGHDHFFAVFNKYFPITAIHDSELIAEVANRAGEQNEQYLELMITPDLDASGMLAKKVRWNPDLSALRQKLLNSGITSIVRNMSKTTDTNDAHLQQLLACKTSERQPGCDVKIRYLYQVLREQPPEQVFGQLVAGFEIASKDPRFVGINMVQPEDGFISMRDYKLHMKMVGFLHNLYPKVRISLHAGELTNGLVPPEGLRFHINDAIQTAHANRIGHGVDIAYENHADDLLKTMAKNKILVEINLTSNEKILGVAGKDHPLPLYMHYHVPVALSTDDEGVLRTDLTNQYQQAVLNYGFNYPTLKNIVRNSINYSFLPGENLWADTDYHTINNACANDSLGSESISSSCQNLLNASEKARMQWLLENRFVKFEANIYD